jgi:methyltransferase (TIGR00027 family)|tara:strand:+ start:871 stop:1761 length:891 start_codon:yes stop_codon:yes gene_type:complete
MKDDQASSTAFTVLQGILHIAKSSPYHYLVDDEAVSVGKQILQDNEKGRSLLKELDGPWFRWSVKFRETLLLPGITLHYILRKRHVEELALKAIDDGVTQVVMLGAGFDTLSWRLHRQYSEVNFIEIDHPATQKLKPAALNKSNAQGPNMHFLSVDFSTQDLQSRLGEFTGFEPTRRTLFICEGVLMYLDVKDVNHLFTSIQNLTGPGTEFLFSTLEPRKSPKNTIPSLLYHYLRFISEPINWDIDSDKMAAFLASHNCELESIAGRDKMLKRFVKDDSNVRLHSGEYFVHCRFEE